MPNKYSPPEVDRLWGMWGSYYILPKDIFHLLKGDYGHNFLAIFLRMVITVQVLDKYMIIQHLEPWELRIRVRFWG